MMSAAELEALLEENESLRDENQSLRGELARGEHITRPDLCWPCEVKRRWLAVIGGSNLGCAWCVAFFRWLEERLRQGGYAADTETLFWSVLGVVTLGPVLGVIISWKVTLFKRSQAWKRWPIYLAWQVYQEARRRQKGN